MTKELTFSMCKSGKNRGFLCCVAGARCTKSCSLSRPRVVHHESKKPIVLIIVSHTNQNFIMSDAAPAKAAPKAKKPAKKADHPPVAAMVNAAIAALKDRKGSSLPAIKKYVAATYKVDIEKLAPFVRRYLKKAVADGKLTQVKGTGASGSFKLAKVEKEKKPKAAKKPAAKKPAAKKSPAKKAAKKPAKKAKTPKKEKKAKKPASAKKPKAKKATKSPAKKAAKKPAAKKAAKKPAAKKAAK